MPKTGKLNLQLPGTNLFWAPSKKEDSKALKQYGFFPENYTPVPISGTVEDAIPREEDFLPFMFRHVSATIVGAGTWKATEFTDKVLRKARPLFENNPAFVNHELSTGNIIGGVGTAKFTSGFTSSDGTQIPGGIDAPIWIDAKLHTDLCRKLQAFPVPHIQSVSVSIIFEWETSHVFEDSSGNEDEWEFERQIGRMVEGRMVRRVVTNIIEVIETSLVGIGADPFAKILADNGDPVNVEKSQIVGADQFDKDPLNELYKDTGLYFCRESSFNKEKALHLKCKHGLKTEKKGKLKPKDRPMEEIISYLAEQLDVRSEDVTLSLVKSKKIVSTEDYRKLKNDADDLGTTKKELADKKTAFEAEKKIADKFRNIVPEDKREDFEKNVMPFDQVVPFAMEGKRIVDEKRKECVRQYKLSVGEENESQAVISLINRSTGEELEGLMKQYGASIVKDKFKAKCSECGSTNVNFRSSESEGNKEEGKGGDSPEDELSMAEHYQG